MATLTERKQAEILAAAARAFRREGIAAARMETVAARAGVSKRTLYKHFPTRDALFDRVIDDAWRKLGAPVAETAPLTAQLDVRLRGFLAARIDRLLTSDNLELFRAVLAESLRSPRLSRAYRGKALDVLTLGLGALLAEETRRRRLAIRDVPLATAQLWGLVMDALFWPEVLRLRARPVPPKDRARVIREAVEIFLSRYERSSSRRSR